MRAVLWSGIPYNVTVASVPVPSIMAATDAIVRTDIAAICGSDLHVYHGLFGEGDVPWVMGHEAIGYISELGDAVTQFNVGDYVIIPDTTHAPHSNLDSPDPAGQAYGLGDGYGSMGGSQAEYTRVPFADHNLISIPDATNGANASGADYVMAADIFPTAWTGLDYAGFEPGDTIAIFGSGPVGLLAAHSAFIRGASRVYVIDHEPSRLAVAESIGAIPINFVDVDPVDEILRREPDGVRRSFDAIGYEAVNRELVNQEDIVMQWALQVTSLRGGVGGVGVWSQATNSSATPRGSLMKQDMTFPMADFFTRGLRLQSGAVDPLIAMPALTKLIANGQAAPGFIVSSVINIEDAPVYYRRFSDHKELKVIIQF
ncbi:hypothetical protein ASPBRDRAFT_117770 [Aspergillus brasiliensis CBS 101740]|uniref:Uncharacterized protein n=1 Tax=Aspergillus brasiliensis (strain CBS 101740 / IMI 381727 / IBT 21946) TaxID=767769 RepID=A0A1L9UY87_ASPBC|nr:hypothetical protein ASPBRDRAFT_117770 [Aspergillus brasiliensis CBS 101740]